MSLRAVFIFAVLIAGIAAPAWAKRMDVTNPDQPRSLPMQGPVSVHWQDPAQFSELRNSHNRSEARRGDWVVQLAAYLRKRAEKRLPTGERLDVDITDIQRAGNYEPWRGIQFDSTRFLRDIYPPRIGLTFKRLGVDGAVLAEGERKLSDFAYLSSGGNFGNSDPLRYEKGLIDRWLAREMPAHR